MKTQNKEVHEKWMNDPEYRKQAIRELEHKLNMQIPDKEFGTLVYAESLN